MGFTINILFNIIAKSLIKDSWFHTQLFIEVLKSDLVMLTFYLLIDICLDVMLGSA